MMKNKILLFGCLFIVSVTVKAQLTVRVAGGYAGAGIMNTESVLGPSINPSTPTIDGLAPMSNFNDSASTYKAVHGSYGAGGNVSVAVGYMFSKFFGIDFAFGYAHSNNISCVQVQPLPLIPGYLTANINSFSWALAVAPSLVITGEKMGWKVYPYSRLGISLPIAGNLTDNVTITNPHWLNVNGFGWLGQRTDVTLVTKATVSLGVNGAIGIGYRVTPYLSINAEVNAQYLNVRGKSSTITKWTASGDSSGVYVVDNDLAARGVYRTQFSYVDQLNSSSNNAQYNSKYNPNQPKQDIRPVVPGSSFGFNVGITLYLSKKTLQKKADKTDKDKPKG